MGRTDRVKKAERAKRREQPLAKYNVHCSVTGRGASLGAAVTKNDVYSLFL